MVRDASTQDIIKERTLLVQLRAHTLPAEDSQRRTSAPLLATVIPESTPSMIREHHAISVLLARKCMEDGPDTWDFKACERVYLCRILERSYSYQSTTRRQRYASDALVPRLERGAERSKHFFGKILLLLEFGFCTSLYRSNDRH
jgi:hypothetical protein